MMKEVVLILFVISFWMVIGGAFRHNFENDMLEEYGSTDTSKWGFKLFCVGIIALFVVILISRNL